MLKVKDVCQMPKKQKYSDFPIEDAFLEGRKLGRNDAIDEISNLPIDLSKVLDVVKLDRIITRHKWETATTAFNMPKETPPDFTCMTLARAIIENINDCVKEGKT